MYWKMMIGFGVIIILMAITNAYIVTELYSVSNTTRSMTLDGAAIDILKELGSILDDEEGYAQKYMISHDPEYATLFSETGQSFSRTLDTLIETAQSPSMVRPIRRIEQSHAWYFGEISSRMKHPPRDSLRIQISEAASESDTLDEIHGMLDDLIARREISVSGKMATVESTARRSTDFALFLTAGTLLVAVTLAFLITRTFTRPIDALVRATGNIAHGSFDQIKVSSGDEIAKLAAAFNRMSASLNEMSALRAEMMQHISHEIRSPLQTMYSAHYILTSNTKNNLTEDQRRLLGSIRENMDKILTFSDQFLDLSKIEAGMMEYNFVRTDIGKILEPVVEQARINASRKGITLDLHAEKVPQVMADVDKCSTIFSNLLSNAVKYTGEGGTIRVSAAPSAFGVRISVADSGVGIAPDELPKVFTKFYRAKNVQGSSKGTGIGLALVKALVESHKGRVGVKSTPGVGSTFTVELPPANHSG